MRDNTYDVAVIGSGFAGSILAWILASRGRRVALIDAQTHPRFAIGESSTPIADSLLRRLGERYQLQPLVDLSAYGRWQKTHPQLGCGCKRGFSYYRHTAGREFTDDPSHSSSLLVAASASNELADTHWYRADVDAYLAHSAAAAGVEVIAGDGVTALHDGEPFQLTLQSRRTLAVDWLIDASGRSAVVAKLRDAANLTEQLRTHTRSTFAHFAGVASWTDRLAAAGMDVCADPFDGDAAAQHHLLDDGWIWMLRFDNDLCSVGWTGPSRAAEPLPDLLKTIARYPSLQQMFSQASMVAPNNAPVISDRLQRLIDPYLGPRCLLLPTAAVTVDPLHSTGIAHGLAGVDRLASIILTDDASQREVLARLYRQNVLAEARLVDRLVATAYVNMHDFERFTAACLLFFVAAISCEERYQRGDPPERLYGADDPQLVSVLERCCDVLSEPTEAPTAARKSVDQCRRAMEPWNTAGLFAAAVSNRYAYTATKRD